MTRPEVADLLAFLGGAYPRHAVTAATIDAWATVLAPDHADAVRAAAHAHVRSGTPWFPSVAELIRRPEDRPADPARGIFGSSLDREDREREARERLAANRCVECRTNERRPGRALCDACISPSDGARATDQAAKPLPVSGPPDAADGAHHA